MNVHLRILITARFTTGEILRAYGMPGCVVDHDMYVVDDEIHDDDDDELQSEIEAEHASTLTRIQQRSTRGTFRMVNPRQRKQVRNNNPQSADNQRPTAYTQWNASETTTQDTTPTTKLLRVHCGHRGTYACRGTASSGIYMQRFPVYHHIPFDQGYAELSKSSSHEGGGGDVRPGRRRGGSSSGKVCRSCIAGWPSGP
jgi:hypothetical protein